MDEDIIDTLEIEIKSKVSKGVDKSIDKLSKALNGLKTVAKGGANLSGVTKQIEKLSIAINNIPKLTRLNQLKNILLDLKSVGNVKINIGSNIKNELESVSKNAKDTKNDLSESLDSNSISKNTIDTSYINTNDGLRKTKEKAENLKKSIDDLINSTTKVDILDAKINSLRQSLQQQLSLPDFKRDEAKIASLIEKIQKLIDKKNELSNAGAGEGQNKFKKFLNSIGSSLKGTTKKASKLLDAFQRIIRYRIVSATLNFINKSLKEGIGNLYQFSKESNGSFAKSLDSLATSMNYFSNSLGTALAPMIEALIPYLTYLIENVAQLFDKIAEVGAAAQGKDVYTSAIKSAKEYAEAANEAKKATIGFDEINVLSSAKETGPNFADNTPVSDSAKNIADNLGAITGLAGVALFAVGALLFFSGIGMGAGLKLMALGLGITALGAKLEWDKADGEVQKQLNIILKYIGFGIAAIGLILCLTGFAMPAGLALICGGLGLAIGGSVGSSNLDEKTKTELGAILAVVGALILALGVILVCTGVGIPAGIAMIVGGAGLLISGLASIDWNYVGNKIKEVFQNIGAWLKDNSKVIIGVLLCFTGAGLPIGIAMLIDANKSGEKSIDFNAFGEKLKSVWNNITNWAKTKVLPIFTPNYWLKKFSVITDAFKATFEAITGFKIKLPHFKIEPEGWNPGDLFKGVIPKLDIQWYANGGYPDSGQLFVAREAGPEMVGQIGGRNAVANNDQIVEAIEQGVFRAMTAAGGESQGGDWTIQIVDGNGNITAETIITSAQRKNRRDGRTVIPIGI